MQQSVLENNDLQAETAPSLEDIWKGVEAGEFIPYFQPKVNLRGMELAGVEALMRWQHPSQGLLSAGVFLPLVADNFLFDELSFIMIERSVVQCVRWQAQGVNVPVSVNLSPDLLRDPGLPERIELKVLEHGLPAHRLMLEVSEAAIAEQMDEVLDNLVQLRQRGFGIAIDDFGTGYCDREQLERIPASELKIDRKMLAGATRREAIKAQLQLSVDIARALNLSAVAEGIENQEEWDLANELGCDMAQGYFIARPMGGDDLIEWLSVWTTDPFI